MKDESKKKRSAVSDSHRVWPSVFCCQEQDNPLSQILTGNFLTSSHRNVTPVSGKCVRRYTVDGGEDRATWVNVGMRDHLATKGTWTIKRNFSIRRRHLTRKSSATAGGNELCFGV